MKPFFQPHLRQNYRQILILFSIIYLGSPSWAKVTRIQITQTQQVSNGKSFGSVGPYQILSGILHYEVDPNNPRNQQIVDIENAPVNGSGMVEFDADFILHLPMTPSRGNKRLMYFVNNRGNMASLWATFHNEGQGEWMYENGWSFFWCGWNGDVVPSNNLMNIRLPVARENGQVITGKIYAEMSTTQSNVRSMPFYWGNSISYPVVDPQDKSQVTLTKREYRESAPITLQDNQWDFARWSGGRAIPDSGNLYIANGFDPGWLYDLVYTGKNPRVTGLGLAAIRDAVSFFRYEILDASQNANPLANAIEKGFGYGISQSGRVLNHIVYQDFNGDEAGRIIFDGMIPHVPGAGKGMFNARFAQTTRHGSHHEDNYFAADFFPHTTLDQSDTITGESGNTLSASIASGFLPKIMVTNTSTEYWTRSASLYHTNVYGTEDVWFHPDVRYYFISAYAHQNTEYAHLARALLVALDEWVTSGTEPPPTVVPRIDQGTLVTIEEYRNSFPNIPGITLPTDFLNPYRLDYGPRWKTQGIMDNVPPIVGEKYVNLVPAVDADGNEVAGIKLPDIAVPTSTRMGWKLRTGAASGTLDRWAGSNFPFPVSNPAPGDPRTPVIDRYKSRDNYLRGIESHIDALIARRLLLPVEKDFLMNQARQKAISLGLPDINVPIQVSDNKTPYYFHILPTDRKYYFVRPLKTIQIINLKGTVLHKLQDVLTRLSWDGKLNNGYPIKSGVYFLKFQTKIGSTIAKVVF